MRRDTVAVLQSHWFGNIQQLRQTFHRRERKAQMKARSVGFVTLFGAALAASGLAFGASVRTYVSGNYLLTIDGSKAGFVKGTSGGGISAQVINEASTPGPFVGKHIGAPRYEPLALSLGFSNTKVVYDWIKATWSATDQRKSVTIDELDRDLKSKSVRTYSGCLLAETTIPALDASSKEPAYMDLKLECESMRATQASNATGKNYGEFGKSEQKLFLPSNFRLEIDGLDCTQVVKIDAFTVRRTITSESTGQARDATKQPGRVEIPNLKITLNETGSNSWKQWFDDFVVRGNSNSKREKTGTLTLLTPNRQQPLVSIKFTGVGIYRLEPAAGASAQETARRVDAELYVETMAFDYVSNTIN